MKGYFEVKMNMSERSDLVVKWWPYLSKEDEDLIHIYENFMSGVTAYNPLDEIRDFVSQYNCESSKAIKARIDMISGHALLNAQQRREIKMKNLLHNTKIKIDSGKGFFHFGYVFSNDIGEIYSNTFHRTDVNMDDRGKIFLLQEATCLDGIKKDRSEYILLKKGEIVRFGDRKMVVKWVGNYSDMGLLQEATDKDFIKEAEEAGCFNL